MTDELSGGKVPHCILAILGLALLLVAPGAEAVCNFTTFPGTVAFGSYSPFGSFLNAENGPFTITCSILLSGTLELSPGSSAPSYDRTMRSGGNTLRYNLYTDMARSTVWGNGEGGTADVTYAAPFLGSRAHTVRIYAQIEAGEDVVPGDYTDTITATIVNGYLANETATFEVTATVGEECTVEAFNLNFGPYDPIVAHATTARDEVMAIRAFCTRTTRVTISLSPGSHYNAGARRMAGPPGQFLRYNIFTTAARTAEWNNVNRPPAADSASKNVPLGGAGGITGYGRVFAGQNIAAGSYNDTVIATVHY